jgi:hypothetical protein
MRCCCNLSRRCGRQLEKTEQAIGRANHLIAEHPEIETVFEFSMSLVDELAFTLELCSTRNALSPEVACAQAIN